MNLKEKFNYYTVSVYNYFTYASNNVWLRQLMNMTTHVFLNLLDDMTEHR